MTRPIASAPRTDSRERCTDPFDAYRGLLDACRHGLVRDVSNSPCPDHVGRYVGSGKTLRPLILFMATSAVGGDPANAMCGAKAIELLHVASLVHDDIIDGAVERRGMPALHVQLGVERALVIGDYLLLRAMTVLTQDTSCDSGTTVRVLGTLGAYAEQCCRGQVRELEPSAAGDREREYAAVAGWKTGAPFAAAASVGAILGGGLDPEIEALGEYGTRLGIAFQIEDDLRDLGDDARVGAETPKGLASLPRHELAIETVRATQASLVALALDALDGLPKSGALDDLYLLPSRLLGCEASPVTRNARHDILTRKSRG